MSNLESEQPLKMTTKVEFNTREIRKIIFATCLGTIIEWYDFFLFATLATTIASKFFSAADPISNVISTLAANAIGFGVRPLGALIFGHVGDLLGRKHTFMITLACMGVATSLVGCLPTVQDIPKAPYVASILLLITRIVQGLAVGGEYGGAATFIAEHAPADKRGYYTSFIQCCATGGLIVSAIITLIVKNACGEYNFDYYGWRIPFLLSIFLVGISIWVRMSLNESPVFLKMKEAGKTEKFPIFSAFKSTYNLKWMALALFGATMGQGVVWYTSQFYSLYFLLAIFKLPFNDAYGIISVALILATPFFVVVGRLSDMYGRKPFMLAGMALAVITYYPIYLAMYQFRYSSVATAATIKATAIVVNPNYSPYALCFFVWLQTMYVTLVYGPIAAFLVELFPASIRYSSMSFPYHIGNGIFGGLVPVISLSWIVGTGNIYSGLFYPFIVVSLCIVIMAVFVPETYKNELFDTEAEKIYGSRSEKSDV